MDIAFDAKRAFHNTTGLGNYSRTLINSLAKFYPGNEYYLFNPKFGNKYQFNADNQHEILPEKPFHKWFNSAWRSYFIKEDLKKNKIRLFHGLSHEIPMGLSATGIHSVVTIHDLIPERFPGQYNPLDSYLYNKKARYACKNADKVICVSSQTQADVINFYGIPESRTEVCYQSCDPAFSVQLDEQEKKRILEKYGLPKQFFLSVGSVIERKNLLNVCKAFSKLKNKTDIPLVVIGNGSRYLKKVKAFILQNNMMKRFIFLSGIPDTGTSGIFQDLPGIYQSAKALIYPSLFEGFGLPVLEAQCSGLPVVTSNISSMPEAGGDAALYVDPTSVNDIAEAMLRVTAEPELVTTLVEKGKMHALEFTNKRCAEKVMNIYRELY